MSVFECVTRSIIDVLCYVELASRFL